MTDTLLTPELPQHIDSTMLVTWKACQRKFHYQFMRGLRPKTGSIHLVAGGSLAAGVEAARKHAFEFGGSHSDLLPPAMGAFAKEWGDFPWMVDDHAKSFPNTFMALDNYLREYSPLTDPVQPYIKKDNKPAVEFSFAIELPINHPVSNDPFIWCGRFDMLGVYNGLPCVLDEKTTSSLGPSWIEQWALRSQFLGYCWACQKLGIPVETAVVRGICILKRDFRFLQVVQQYPTWQIERWYEEMLLALQDIVNAYNSGLFRMDYGDSCSSYGGCMYQPLCTSKDPSAWYSEYDTHFWNPIKFNPANEKEPAHVQTETKSIA